MSIITPKNDCPHVPSNIDVPKQGLASLLTKHCYSCESSAENWLCLSCLQPFCSRYVAGHFQDHHKNDDHHVGLSLADLSFWCCVCDSYIESPDLKPILWEIHKAKFGHYPGEEGDIESITKSLQQTKLEEKEADPVKSVAEFIKSGAAKRIIVLSGAGLSTAAGIPDFRTPGTGLYDNLSKYNLPHPTAIFELPYFLEHPIPFFELAKDFITSDYVPTPGHYFIKLLEDKRLLVRNYTQNIDALELKAGISRDSLVQAHGSYDTATCTKCRKKYPNLQYIKEHIAGDTIKVPICNACKKGIVKPDVVFFGEALPTRFATLVREDFENCDLLFIIGTSLRVYPVAGLVDLVPKGAMRCLVNMEPAGPFATMVKNGAYQDLFIEGDINAGIWKLIDELGWRDDLQRLIDAGPIKLE